MSCTLYCDDDDDDDGDSARITYYLYTNVRPSSVFAHFARYYYTLYFTCKQIESDRRCSHLDGRSQLIIIISIALLGPVSGNGRTRDIYILLSCVGKKESENPRTDVPTYTYALCYIMHV